MHYVRRHFEFKDMKLTNRAKDTQQRPETIKDKEISKITICGITNEVCKWKIVNTVRPIKLFFSLVPNLTFRRINTS